MENNLKKERESQNISRYRMAKELQMDYMTLKGWEESQTLSPDKMRKCADFLKVELSEIFKF